MLGNLGFGELLAIIVIGLLVFGPERLPGVARDAGKAIRELRRVVTGAATDLQKEMGPEFQDLDVASLDPRRMVRQVVEGDEAQPPRGSVPAARSPRTPDPFQLAPGEPAPFDPDAT